MCKLKELAEGNNEENEGCIQRVTILTMISAVNYLKVTRVDNVPSRHKTEKSLNPLNPELNPICYLLALLAHHFLHVSKIRVKSLTLGQLMSYMYGAPILDVSRSHTTTHHSR